jgi:hypothetical protein
MHVVHDPRNRPRIGSNPVVRIHTCSRNLYMIHEKTILWAILVKYKI